MGNEIKDFLGRSSIQQDGCLHQQIGLKLIKKLVECCIWSTVLYGAETWTLGKLYQKCQESFETWCWRRVDKTVGPIV
jgi:hypothetical protein